MPIVSTVNLCVSSIKGDKFLKESHFSMELHYFLRFNYRQGECEKEIPFLRNREACAAL